MTEFEWLVDLGASPAVWSEQADEWLHWFSTAINEGVPGITVGGQRYDDTTKPFIQVTLDGDGWPPDVALFLGVTEVVIRVFAGGSGRQPNQDTLDALATAVQQAASRLGDEGSEHAWSAVIGHPAERLGGTEKRLAESFGLGSMTIESSGVTFAEPDTSQQAALGAWAPHASVPLRVRGSNRGYSWQTASVRAARDLRTLCGLLSIAWDSSFAVREAAAPLSWGLRTPPDRPPWYANDAFQMESEGLTEPPGEEVVGPPWLGEAWRMLQERERLLGALDAYLEGVYTEGRHPSLAAVSYTACVETIAGTVYRLGRCKDCGNQFGLGQSFKAALRLVLSEHEAQELDAVYGVRSRTVHAGRLHGEEAYPGVFRLATWSTDSARDFRWGTLRGLRRAAGSLLQMALMDALPPKTRLPAREAGP